MRLMSQIKRLSKNDIGHGMIMSLINKKSSEGKLYRKVMEHLRKCNYDLDEFFNTTDFIICMLEDNVLQKGTPIPRRLRKGIAILLEAGFIERLEALKIEGYYMPHFGVKKESRTTPLCIVFNASVKSKDRLSLNDCLLSDPNLVEALYNWLSKFRFSRYALTADISKAFHSILLDPSDAKYTGFLWCEAPNRTATFAFQFVVFSVTVSPFLLRQVLQTHLQREGRPDLLSQFYVDNYIQTFNETQSLMQEHKCTRENLERANMPLTGWTSNVRELDERMS
ncbi:uncharacterized protein LOC135200681 [Macrobrachium nipponense]|uniref:uncharacterized protein LOC135200681 n=1 Tax=Macrobrachium nipponense TaxID=159736 RepID=UPI0030C84A8D